MEIVLEQTSFDVILRPAFSRHLIILSSSERPSKSRKYSWNSKKNNRKDIDLFKIEALYMIYYLYNIE